MILSSLSSIRLPKKVPQCESTLRSGKMGNMGKMRIYQPMGHGTCGKGCQPGTTLVSNVNDKMKS